MDASRIATPVLTQVAQPVQKEYELDMELVNGIWHFNPNGQEQVTFREFEAGRVAHGLRRMAEVNKVEMSILAEMDDNLKYQILRGTGLTIELLRTYSPTKGWIWKKTGNEDPGYVTELGGKRFPHQTTGAMAAITFATRDVCVSVPFSERYEAEVNRQNDLAKLTGEALTTALRSFKEDRKASTVLF